MFYYWLIKYILLSEASNSCIEFEGTCVILKCQTVYYWVCVFITCENSLGKVSNSDVVIQCHCIYILR